MGVCVCVCVLRWVVEEEGRRQQRVGWIKPEWKNSLSFLWALIITPRESPLHIVYLLSQLAVYTLSLSHAHTHTHTHTHTYTRVNALCRQHCRQTHTRTHSHTDVFQQTYKYGHKHVITTMHGPVSLAPLWHTHTLTHRHTHTWTGGGVTETRRLVMARWFQLGRILPESNEWKETKRQDELVFLAQVSFQESSTWVVFICYSKWDQDWKTENQAKVLF